MSTTTNHKQTYRQRLTNIEAASRFVKSLPKTKEGANSHLSDFMFLAHFVLNNYGTFSLSNFLTLGQAKEIPAEETKKLFKLWTEKMVLFGIVSKVNNSCYDEDTFNVL